MQIIYLLLLVAVIAGHFVFAQRQWFNWPFVAKKILGYPDEIHEITAGVGRSFASYNASIAVGLCLSFLLEPVSRHWVQGVVLALIVLTAIVGTQSTKGNFILYFRLSPAAAALIALVIWQLTS